MYIPPFTISTSAINLIAEISAQIERYAIRLEQSDGLRLRKANRVRTIHSSLAIEGNTLSEDEVKDIIEGKTVMAPLRQIQEVKTGGKTADDLFYLPGDIENKVYEKGCCQISGFGKSDIRQHPFMYFRL